MTPLSSRLREIQELVYRTERFFTESEWARRQDDPTICDFVTGHAHEWPLTEMTDALAIGAKPMNVHWFAYKTNDSTACEAVAAALRHSDGLTYRASDIFLTNGATAGLTVALMAFVDPGESVVCLGPAWFFYEALIASAGARPVVVPMRDDRLDFGAIERALTSETGAFILNTPHNPSGRVFTHRELEDLATLLEEASRRRGRPIPLIADEAYRRIIFDGRAHISPAGLYPSSIVVYTYGKTLLAPGERLGYLAVHPDMPDGARVRAGLYAAQILCGWAFPSAVLQHALPTLERVSIDVARVQARRDRLVAELGAQGYDLRRPEGGLFMLVRSPIDDDRAFARILAERDIFVLLDQ